MVLMAVMKFNSWLRKEKLSQAEFARRHGFNQQTVNRYALGRRVPRDPKTLKRLIRAMRGEVTVGDLLGFKTAA